MLRGASLLAIITILLTSAIGGLPVAKNGKALCEVTYDPAASLAERHAAAELADYLKQITGADIPLREARNVMANNAILVGYGAVAAEAFPEVDPKKLEREEAITRFKRGRNGLLLICGGSPRGTLYAAYRLLDRMGVKWWAPWATSVPKNRTLTIPDRDYTEKPALEYRQALFYAADSDNVWAAHNYLNGGSEGPDLGGAVTYQGFVHTYNVLVDPKIYFPIHPEWYSLIGGKRTADNAQLCTTDPALRAFVLDRVRQLLRANPNVDIVSVSQNDCFNFCQCDRCQALAKEEGSQSAPVIALANYVSDGIKDEFPNVAIDTLAYQWSRHAPKSLKPRPNVIVRLCSIECDFGVPLNAPKNQDFAKDVSDWNALTNRLYIWDYVTNFANYLSPMPDEAVLGPNVQFLASHGAKGIFEEGDHTSNGGAMSELKTWMLARLLWDPKADAVRVEKEFLDGYYGTAAKPIQKFVQLMDEAAAKTKLTIFQPTDAAFLTPANILDSEKLWQEAERKVAKDPALLWRVKESHLAIQYVILRRWNDLKAFCAQTKRDWVLPANREDYSASWLTFATQPGPAGWQPTTAVNERGDSPQKFVQSVARTPAK